MFTSQAKAKDFAGGISSRNRKMPGSSYALPPSLCKVGGKLADVEGSVCYKCYAAKSEAMYPSVKQGWGDNYLKATSLIANKPEQWAQAMAFQIRKQAEKSGENYHRWFDGGDLQSVAMMFAIVRTCELTPHIEHWMPSREAAIIKAWIKAGGVAPANLVIRISSTMIGDAPIKGHALTSTVHRHGLPHVGQACPSSSPEHRALREDKASNCGTCRTCWSKEAANVSYPLH